MNYFLFAPWIHLNKWNCTSWLSVAHDGKIDIPLVCVIWVLHYAWNINQYVSITYRWTGIAFMSLNHFILCGLGLWFFPFVPMLLILFSQWCFAVPIAFWCSIYCMLMIASNITEHERFLYFCSALFPDPSLQKWRLWFFSLWHASRHPLLSLHLS